MKQDETGRNSIGEKLDRIIDLLEVLVENTAKVKKQKALPITSDNMPMLVKLWNEWSEDLPKVERIASSQQRYKSALSRWKEHPDEGYWVRVIRKIAKSDFCNGKNQTNRAKAWVATFDFLVRPDTCSKVMEGKYDNKKYQKQRIIGTTESGFQIVG